VGCKAGGLPKLRGPGIRCRINRRVKRNLCMYSGERRDMAKVKRGGARAEELRGGAGIYNGFLEYQQRRVTSSGQEGLAREGVRSKGECGRE